MLAQTSESPAPWTAGQQWAQTSFLAEDINAVQADCVPRAAAEALGAADHAADRRARHAALDRLAVHLTEQALQRGRTPVPKRAI